MPPLLRATTSDRAETFFTDTRHCLGWVLFFVSKKIAPLIFSRFDKICPSEKTSVFSGTLGILAFLFEQKKIKRNHPKQCLVPVKKSQLDRT